MSKLVSFGWAIKHLLRNKANFDVLEGFLSELLKLPIKIEGIIESQANKKQWSFRTDRIAVSATTTSGERLIIKLQTTWQWDYLSRILYDTPKLISEHIQAGDGYKKIHKRDR